MHAWNSSVYFNTVVVLHALRVAETIKCFSFNIKYSSYLLRLVPFWLNMHMHGYKYSPTQAPCMAALISPALILYIRFCVGKSASLFDSCEKPPSWFFSDGLWLTRKATTPNKIICGNSLILLPSVMTALRWLALAKPTMSLDADL